MTFRILAAGALALLLSVGAVACGGEDDNNSGTRPSVDEISKLVKDNLPPNVSQDVGAKLADCLARELHGSDMPNGVLRKVAANEDAEVDKDNKDKYNKIVSDAQETCTAELAGSGAGG